jgi:protein arginine N-methyltransferase 1
VTRAARPLATSISEANPIPSGDARTGSAERRFPAWPVAPVEDHVRNAAIERSIAALDLAGRTVVEIGTGTGLLALLFATHGATRVVSCETDPALVRAARHLVDGTPHANRITIIEASSSDALERRLLPVAPDVIFAETLDCGVVGDGFLSLARDIQRIAGPHTIVMPNIVRQFAMLIDSAAIADLEPAGPMCEFDVRTVNADPTSRYFPVDLDRHAHRVLSATMLMRRYRYLGSSPATPVRTCVSRSGTIHGVLSWFAAEMGAATLTNEPYVGGHRHQAFHPLEEQMDVAAGDLVTVVLDDDGRACVDAFA